MERASLGLVGFPGKEPCHVVASTMGFETSGNEFVYWCYRGGVVAIAGVIVFVAAPPGDLESGVGTFDILFRLAMICIFFLSAARRMRML